MLCESPGCAGPVATGQRLCPGCERTAREELLRLPGLYGECEAALVPVPTGPAQRITRTRAVGLNLNEAAVNARSDILDILSSWSAMVAHQRRVTPPARVVERLVAFLDGHFDWLSRHEAAADFAAEIHDLAARARAAIERAPAARPLGPCGRKGCGEVVSVIRRGDGRDEVRCGAGHVWRSHEWLALSLRMRRAAGERVA